MNIDIFNIQPSVVDRSLSGKTILLAGAPKIGKSTFCAESPRTLIIDLEGGYNSHPGVMKVQITKWSEFKVLLKQLEKPEAHNLYDNVAIDTIPVLWELCSAYICSQAGVQNIADVPYGRAYKARDTEFENALRKIVMLNFGLILVAHTKETVVGTKGDVDIISIAPDLDKRCLPILNRLVDIIGIITQTWNENGESERWLLTKATPTIAAGSRWATLESRIPFGYKYLQEAIVKAIEAEEKNGAKVVDKVEQKAVKEETFDEVMEHARSLWSKLIVGEDELGNLPKVNKKIEMIFGHPTKLSEVSEDQKDLLALVVMELEEMASKM